MRSDTAKRLPGLLLAAALLNGGPAAADVWDEATGHDNGTGTDNAPAHGAEQVHDVKALPGPLADQDWYRVTIHPYSSLQFVVDGQTGELDFASTDVQLISSSGSVLTSAIATEGGGVLSLNFDRRTGGPPEEAFVRVTGASCGTACNVGDRYRARLYDTTYAIPRVNGSGTQVTSLLIQNASRECIVTIFILGADGQLVGTVPVADYQPNALHVVSTEIAGLTGSARVVHTCGYGGLSGKAVSVEPATGFTFDTPLLPRPW